MGLCRTWLQVKELIQPLDSCVLFQKKRVKVTSNFWGLEFDSLINNEAYLFYIMKQQNPNLIENGK